MQAPFDLDAYLSRIGYDPARRSLTSPALSGLLAAHMNAIPFENIDVLLGRPIRLDLDGVAKEDRHRPARRLLLRADHAFPRALRALGFDATPRTARVILVLSRTPRRAATCTSPIRLPEGEFVADPGLGGMGCRADRELSRPVTSSANP